VESYEIRPGVLATPKYARNGALCQISIEKRHVQDASVDLGSTIPHKLSLEMIEELAPPSERGRADLQFAGSDYIYAGSGSMEIATADYKNILVQIFKTRSDPGDTAVILKWKNACDTPQKSKRTPEK
jgi:hypothetical protein